ncbi:hypothetical protein AWJ20_3960 [Sugiyamaella lignohabitans]|uniref:Major facilitator superfamily (MFS) profile domain-containing protein n=1 Tax=Sugiyamaella lignohabitans TaxID=796027 RepID=A0A167C326_9ASCO|nr:uncharacterized protein AWJ20_3960 [Sugiyamaella lignohabitans]ANB11159.1 hypothetical protein AWJ20_3960 [Sugiyamaella lignohabitans]
MTVLLFMSMTLKFWQIFDYKWIVLSYIITGIFGSGVLSAVMVSSYVTDSIKPRDRATAMGYVTACVLTGKALGPLISSHVIRCMNGKLIGVPLVACLFDAAALVWWKFTPESRQLSVNTKSMPMSRREEGSALSLALDRLNIFRSLYTIKNIAASQPNPASKNIFILISIDLLFEIIISGRANIAILYPEMKFGWTAVEIGYLQSATAVYRIVLLVLLIPHFIKLLQKYYDEDEEELTGQIAMQEHCITRSQKVIIAIGNCFECVGYMGYGIATKGLEYSISYFISTTGVFSKPAVQSGLLNLIPADQVGEFLGAKGVLDGITGLMFSSIGLSFYSYTVARNPAIIFYVCTFGYLIVVLLASRLRLNRQLHL